MTTPPCNPSYKDLQVVNNEYCGRNFEIMISIPEFTCVCPRTGLPDFATIEINYIPDKTIIELKSMKLYIVKFRNVGIFHEHVTNRILDDLSSACTPKKIEVRGIFRPRGGISTTVVACEKNNI
jgi:7-cyano-7-deazaguanine reductase